MKHTLCVDPSLGFSNQQGSDGIGELIDFNKYKIVTSSLCDLSLVSVINFNPKSAYTMWKKSAEHKFKKKYPELTKIKDINDAMVQVWNNLKIKVRVKWEKLAEDDATDLETITMANNGLVTNRLINLTNSLENRIELRRILSKQKMSNKWIVHSTITEQPLTKTISFVLFMSDNTLYSVMIDDDPSMKEHLATLINISTGITGGQHLVIAGNQFNKNRVGAFQVYRSQWLKQRDGYILDYIKAVSLQDLLRDEKKIVKTYFDTLADFHFDRTMANHIITETIASDVRYTYISITPTLNLDSRNLYTMPKGTFVDYVRDGYQTVLQETLGFIEINSETGEFMPKPNIPYNVLAYRRASAFNKLNNAIMNASALQNVSGIRSILSDKGLYFQALRYVSSVNESKICPETVEEVLLAKKNPELYKKFMVPFTDDFSLTFDKKDTINKDNPNLREKLTPYFGIKGLRWLFKPTQGTQGVGIFVYQCKGDPTNNYEKDYDALIKVIQNEIDTNTTTRRFDTWQISQFIDNPLLFRPFGDELESPGNLKITNNNYAHLSKKQRKKEEKLFYKGGRKSHLRFYMVIVEATHTDGTKHLQYYMLPDSCMFLAVLPYKTCINLLNSGENGMKHKELYNEHIYEDSSDKCEIDEKTGMCIDQTATINYCNQSNLTLGGHYFAKRGLVGNSYGIFAENAETVIDKKLKQSGYYQNMIIPQLQEIAKYTAQCVELCHMDPDGKQIQCDLDKSKQEALCTDNNNCFQFIAIDVMYDDGRYSGGVPQPFILEANMTPGLKGPSSILGEDAFKEMISEIIKHGIGISPNNEAIDDTLLKSVTSKKRKQHITMEEEEDVDE